MQPTLPALPHVSEVYEDLPAGQAGANIRSTPFLLPSVYTLAFWWLYLVFSVILCCQACNVKSSVTTSFNNQAA